MEIRTQGDMSRDTGDNALTSEDTGTPRRKLSVAQKTVMGLLFVPMLAVGIGGGVGTYSNISKVYGSDTATGALAAGEGATAILALLLLYTTLLGQASPLVVRVGLWALPALAAVMGATAAQGDTGRTVVYAATPAAITASAEGLALVVRRVVIYQDGRDVEAQARAAKLLKDLAYHQALSVRHPDEKKRERAAKKSWRLARKIGVSDPASVTGLLDVQRDRIGESADSALRAMFSPGAVPAVPTLSPGQRDTGDSVPTLSPGQRDTGDSVPGEDNVTAGQHDAVVPTAYPVVPSLRDTLPGLSLGQRDTGDTAPVDVPGHEDTVTEVVPVPAPPVRDMAGGSMSSVAKELLRADPDAVDEELKAVLIERFGLDAKPNSVRTAIRRARQSLEKERKTA